MLGTPARDRMPCLLLHGESNIGKTQIIRKFVRNHPSTFDEERGVERLRDPRRDGDLARRRLRHRSVALWPRVAASLKSPQNSYSTCTRSVFRGVAEFAPRRHAAL